MNYKLLDKWGIVYRLILILLFVALISPFAVPSFAMETDWNGTVSVNEERFCTQEMSVENAFAKVNDDGTLRVSVSGANPKISMMVTPIKAETKANALRLVIKNSSEMNVLNIEYIYKNSAHISETGSARVPLKNTSYAEEYIVPVNNPDTMTHLVLSFEGSEKNVGDIDLVSIGAISYCFDNREYFGSVTQNSYDDSSKKAEFSGSVVYEKTLEYPDAQIVLYRLEQRETIEDVHFVHPYVASCPMSLSFKFTLEMKNASDICSRYFAAILTEEGVIIPLTPETYLKNKNSVVSEPSETVGPGFKGIETNLYAGASENGTSVAFVDVYLNRLINNDGDGFQYVLGQGKEYYFDRTYVSGLDARIRSHRQAGASVYLRFLVDSCDPAFGCIASELPLADIKYYAINPKDDDIVDNVYACTDFLLSRYSLDGMGALKGVILGRSLDKNCLYNYCGAVSMSEYADTVSRVYSIIRNVLDKRGNGLEIVLPMSDARIGKDTIINQTLRDSHYASDLLSGAILRSLTRYGSDTASLYFMLESEGLPTFLKNESEKLSLLEHFIGAENSYVFVEMVRKLSADFAGLPGEVIFCWIPSARLSSYELLTSYMYNYNLLACAEGIRNYTISIFERNESIISDTETVSSEKNIFSLLKSTYKYADTYNNPVVSAAALAAAGKDSWNEIINNYDVNKIIKRNLVEVNALYYMPENISGSYRMWDFSSSNGLNGWNASDGCESLSVYTPSNDLSRALVVGLNWGAWKDYGADYGSIVYNSESALSMNNISGLSFDLIIPAELSESVLPNEMFEVKITVGGEGTALETTGIIKSDALTSVYTDISGISKVEYIKFSLRSLEGADMNDVKLCVNSISIHSDVYNDTELENIVLSGELMGKTEEAVREDTDVISILGATLIFSVLAVVIGWGIFYAVNKKNNF